MGATSVTGIGPGSSEGLHKGPGNGRNLFVPLQTPHVISAGTVTLASGVATVTFPTPLGGSETGYVVMLTAEADDYASVSAKTDNADGNFASFAITDGSGSNSSDVMWMVVKAGWA